MHERRSVTLVEDIRPDLDNIVRTDAQEKPVEGRVMEGAQSKPVLNPRLAERFRVRNDVGYVQQLFMAQPTECALRR